MKPKLFCRFVISPLFVFKLGYARYIAESATGCVGWTNWWTNCRDILLNSSKNLRLNRVKNVAVIFAVSC